MDRFVSHYMLRLDAKGRVSVPAPFRAVLARDGFDGLYCYPALDRPALDAGGNALMAEIAALSANFLPYSERREQLALALYGTSETLKIDGEGRVVNVFVLDIADGLVQTVRSIVNPDKLHHLGPVSDVALRAPRDLTCRPWAPTSPRKQRPARSSTASRRRRTRGCASC